MICRAAGLALLALATAAPAQLWAQGADFSAAAADESAQCAADTNRLRVGVRSQARPFSYSTGITAENLTPKSGPLRDRGYDGYIVYICDEVLKQMLIGEIDTPPMQADHICAADVDTLMEGRDDPDRLNLLGEQIDILCDPATISRERVRRFAVSPPVFVTGIGFLKLRDADLPSPQCPGTGKALIGVVRPTNAMRYGIRAILDGNEWNQYRDLIIAALRAPNNSPELCPKSEDVVSGIIWEGATHDEVAKRFCDGEFTYYVGDLEIIAAHASQYAGCDFYATPQTYTDDRYGVYASIDYTGDAEKALWIGRFFEVLNREVTASDSLLDRAYLAEFGTAGQSAKLEMFYWSIRGTPGAQAGR